MNDTPIADMVEQMLSAGSPVEIVILAVRTAERIARAGVPIDHAAERRRQWDRNRKAAARDNSGGKSAFPLKSSLTTSDVVITGISNQGSKSETASPVEIPPDKKKARTVGSSLPDGWQPNERHHALVVSLGRDDRFLAKELHAMRDWAKANSNRAIARKADWDATFSGWLRRAAERGGGRGPAGPDRPTFFAEATGGHDGRNQ